MYAYQNRDIKMLTQKVENHLYAMNNDFQILAQGYIQDSVR